MRCSAMLRPILFSALFGLLQYGEALTGSAAKAGTRSTNIICPPGAYCPELACETTDCYQEVPCPAGYFCQTGTSNPVTCNYTVLLSQYNNVAVIPSGSGGLLSPNAMVYIYGQNIAGNYCPDNSTSPNLDCEEGTYCPTVNSSDICPSDHFCKAGTAEPVSCSAFGPCDEGSSKPGVSWGAVVGTILFLFAAWCIYAGAFYFYKRKDEQSKLYVAERQQLFLALGPLLGPQFDPRQQRLSLFSDIEPKLSIKFENLSLRLKGGGPTLLKSVSGEFKHSHLYAVMGPSGAGKSTFTNALLGTAKAYAEVSGSIWVNDEATDMGRYKDVVGYVPQDDIVHEDLTVRENLMYSARLRSPGTFSVKQCTDITEAVIDLMALRHVSDSVVGGVELRGISGGQRKRVNIGTELVTRPSVCFMDEPTSGLDATATVDVLTTLKALCSKGMNIITVVHQPRYSVFTLYDSVLLLGKGGFTAYFGPTTQMIPYIESLGFKMAENENPADFALDVVSGSIECAGHADFEPSELESTWEKQGLAFIDKMDRQADAALRVESMRQLSRHSHAHVVFPSQVRAIHSYFHAQEWAAGQQEADMVLDKFKVTQFLEHMAGKELEEEAVTVFMNRVSGAGPDGRVTVAQIMDYIEAGTYKSSSQVGPELEQAKTEHVKLMLGEPGCCSAGGLNRTGPNLFTIFCLLVVRTLVKKVRSWTSIVANILLILLTALICGSASGAGYGVVGWNQILMFFQLVFSMMMAIVSVAVFGKDKVVYIRETKAGLNTTSLFFAQMAVHLIDIIILSLVYSAFWSGFVNPQINFGWTYAVMLCVAWYSAGIAYWCSIIISMETATVLALAILLIMNGFVNGITLPTTPDTGSVIAYRYLNGFMRFFVGLSSSRWGVEIMMRQEYVEYPTYRDPSTHEIMARIGLCGLSNYSSPYDLRTFPEDMEYTLNTTTLDDLRIGNYCQDVLTWDFLALLLLGSVWRLFSWIALWFRMRPEIRSPAGWVLWAISWQLEMLASCFSRKKD